MPATFFEQPILNSRYEPPSRHHDLDKDGQPLDLPPASGRRRSELITPVPKARKKQRASEQAAVPRLLCYSFPWRDLRRRANAGCESLIHAEITPPYLHRSRYGTPFVSAPGNHNDIRQ